MQPVSSILLRFLISELVAACAAGFVFADDTDTPLPVATKNDIPASDAQNSEASEAARVPLEVARDRARLMHEIYIATLDVMHDRYFHAERAIVPARAMEDVFSHMDNQNGSKANWISVNLRAMSINHEPKTDFEKRAAREIASGTKEIEVIEDGFYRSAGAIPMTGGCISCHGGFANKPTKAAKFTGLVISIPVLPQASDE